MKSIVCAIFLGILVSSYAGDDLSQLANMPGAAGDAARDILKYPALPLELPHETEARRALLKWKDSCVANGTWTPQLELELQKQLAALAKAMSDRIAKENEKDTVIVIER